jgi:hypothetical protein
MKPMGRSLVRTDIYYRWYCLLLHYLADVGKCGHIISIGDSIGANDAIHLCQVLAEKQIKEATDFVPSCALRWTSGKHAKAATRLNTECAVVSVAA